MKFLPISQQFTCQGRMFVVDGKHLQNDRVVAIDAVIIATGEKKRIPAIAFKNLMDAGKIKLI